MTTKRQRVGGFTIVETVIAIMILAMVMGGTYQLVYSTARLTQKARLHFLAMHIANNRLERARNFSFMNLPLMTDSNQVVNDQGALDDAGVFRRTTTVVTNANGNLTKVTVKVNLKNLMTGGWNTNEYESVSTYLTIYTAKPIP